MTPTTQAIFKQMGDRYRQQIDALKHQADASDLIDTQAIAKIHAEVIQILPKDAA